jgi:hypothetical protein
MTRMRTAAVWVVLTGAALTGCAGAATDRSSAAPGSPPSSPVAAPTAPATASAGGPSAGPGAVPPEGTEKPGLSATDPPVIGKPTGPPKEPTDLIKKTDRVTGVVTRGGSGPCFGMQTDDGVEYALHSSQARSLTKGSRITAQVKPSMLRINCGSGRLVEIQAVEPVR